VSLFVEPIRCTFTPSEWDIFMRPIEGHPESGYQQLLRILQHSTTKHREGLFEDSDLQAAYGCAYDYGSGGYQGRFRVVCAAAFRAGWVQP